MKIKTLISTLLLSSILFGCNSGNSNQSQNNQSTAMNQEQAKPTLKSSNLYNPSMQYAIVFGSTSTGVSAGAFGALAYVNGIGMYGVDLADLAISTTVGIFVGGAAVAIDGIYKALSDTVHRRDGYQHINFINVGPQMNEAQWPLMISGGGMNSDDGSGDNLFHQYNGSSWSNIDRLSNGEISQISVSWDKTIDYANSRGLNLAEVTPYMVIATKYGEVDYYDPSRGQWFPLVDESHRGNLEHINEDGKTLGNTVTGMSVLWPSTGGDPRVVLATDNNDSNGAEVYYYNGHSWTNFGITSGNNDWGRHNAVNILQVSWNRYGYETPDTSAPYIVAGTNYGEVKYYDPSRSSWFDLIRDDNKGNIEKIASGRSIENNEIGAMAVDWSVSGDPQVALGTSNSGDNGADVYYYNGHIWNNFGVTTHNGDWGVDNAVTAMNVAWCGQDCTPRIVAGTNYAEVKYYDPARSGWFDLVRNDNRGNIDHIANGKSIEGNAILDLQAFWSESGDPQVVISTNNSDKNHAEVYYYDSHIWNNFGNPDWGKDNSAPVLRVYWPLNDDLTPKGNGTPYIIAGTTYGEVKVFDPTVGYWTQNTIFH
jgi:hypothetical protein